jgi:hypothetical protein
MWPFEKTITERMKNRVATRDEVGLLSEFHRRQRSIREGFTDPTVRSLGLSSLGIGFQHRYTWMMVTRGFAQAMAALRKERAA